MKHRPADIAYTIVCVALCIYIGALLAQAV